MGVKHTAKPGLWLPGAQSVAGEAEQVHSHAK